MKLRRWLITLLACALVFAALATYKILQIRAAIAFGEAYPEPSETVEAVVVENQPLQREFNTVGEIVAPHRVTLHNELEGRIVAVNVRSGERVAAGDILLQLDVAEERARLRAAEARAELAKLDLQRVSALLKNNTVSEDRGDQARAEYTIALADSQALQAVISKKTVVAPFAGRVGIHQLEVGEYLQSNTLITTVLGDSDELWVDFDVPLSPASIGHGTPVVVSLFKPSNLQFNGEVIARETAISPTSRNLRYRARLAHDPQLLPNAIVHVGLLTGARQQLPRIPVTAYRQDAMGDYVYRLEVDNSTNAYRAQRQSVTAGIRDGQFIYIVSGLKAGDLIATQGAFKLRDELLVYVSERSSSPAAHSAAVEQ